MPPTSDDVPHRARRSWPLDLVRLDPRRAADKLLILLLIADVVLIVLHLLHHFTPLFSNPSYNISAEREFGETLQYFKEGWIVVVLSVLAVRLRSISHACWAFVIGVLLWDDQFQFREIQGPALAERMDLPALFGLRPRDLGELIIVGAYLALIAVPVVVAYVLDRQESRRFWSSMVVLLAALFVVGVIFDMLHTAVFSPPPWGAIFAVAEDGGEMVVMSLLLRFVFQTWQETDLARVS